MDATPNRTVPNRLDKTLWAILGRPTKRRREVIVPLVVLCVMLVLWAIAFLEEGYSASNFLFFLTFFCLMLARLSSGVSRFVYEGRFTLARLFGLVAVMLMFTCVTLLAVTIIF